MTLMVKSIVCLILLSGVITSTRGEEFPQCANADLDTFVMAIDDCASYIYCNGADSFRDSCPESTYFDDRTKECAFDDEGVCLSNAVSVFTEDELEQQTDEEVSDSPVPTPPFHDTILDSSTPPADSLASSSVSSTTSSAPTTSSPAIEKPHCDLFGDGDYPHPQRCEYFYRCLSGYLTIVRCPYKYGWDLPTKRCKPIADTQCYRP
ncbi:uncharacterized protein LOC108095398 [Drosophila ficusphila]|uniref:uncharacterized protein LOC108095398 n=1 Tax=Drosophila ficusphila TaxID=30025 RepID=UPI0007E84640|nr:uncharacterized protein LOC108095398 [Drosophila ficusphila]